MSDKEKILEYEMQIEDMLHALQKRLDEFKGKEVATEFEQGRQIAYLEMMDIIKNRYKMIWDVIGDEN